MRLMGGPRKEGPLKISAALVTLGYYNSDCKKRGGGNYIARKTAAQLTTLQKLRAILRFQGNLRRTITKGTSYEPDERFPLPSRWDREQETMEVLGT